MFTFFMLTLTYGKIKRAAFVWLLRVVVHAQNPSMSQRRTVLLLPCVRIVRECANCKGCGRLR